MKSRKHIGAQFGDNLKRWRKSRGMSQEELALGAALHRTEISLLEQGEREPRLDTAIRLASTLGVSIAELVKGIEWKPTTTRAGEYALHRKRRSGNKQAKRPGTGPSNAGASVD